MKLFFISLFLFPLLLIAGEGWVGSGGELFKDAHNPWFIKNTKDIRYCVQVDQNTFSANITTVENEVSTAINYWTNEFLKVGKEKTPGRFNLGGQRIIKEKCGVLTDITFKFGHGTLTKEEIKHLQRPEKYIGVTIRKSYSKKELRGKGIIYISSDLGAHQYENPEGNLISKAWSKPKLLRFALIHEVGHVFGIPHSGNSIMSQIFLDQLLNKYLVENFVQLPIDSFLQPDNVFKTCTMDRKIKTFVFKLKSTEGCLKVFKESDGSFKLFGVNEKNEARLVGSLGSIYPVLWDINSRPASILQITKSQNVFTPLETGFRSFMYGPLIQDQGYKATLFINGALPKSVYLKVRSTSFAIYGEYKKKIEPLVITQSPLSLLLLKEPTQ